MCTETFSNALHEIKNDLLFHFAKTIPLEHTTLHEINNCYCYILHEFGKNIYFMKYEQYILFIYTA